MVETREDEYVWDSDDDSQEDNDASCTDESVMSDNSDLGLGQNLYDSEENLSTDEKPNKYPIKFSDVNDDPDDLLIVRNEAESCEKENNTDYNDELQTSDLSISPELSENEKDVACEFVVRFLSL